MSFFVQLLSRSEINSVINSVRSLDKAKASDLDGLVDCVFKKLKWEPDCFSGAKKEAIKNMLTDRINTLKANQLPKLLKAISKKLQINFENENNSEFVSLDNLANHVFGQLKMVGCSNVKKEAIKTFLADRINTLKVNQLPTLVNVISSEFGVALKDKNNEITEEFQSKLDAEKFGLQTEFPNFEPYEIAYISKNFKAVVNYLEEKIVLDQGRYKPTVDNQKKIALFNSIHYAANRELKTHFQEIYQTISSHFGISDHEINLWICHICAQQNLQLISQLCEQKNPQDMSEDALSEVVGRIDPATKERACLEVFSQLSAKPNFTNDSHNWAYFERVSAKTDSLWSPMPNFTNDSQNSAYHEPSYSSAATAAMRSTTPNFTNGSHNNSNSSRNSPNSRVSSPESSFSSVWEQTLT